MDKKVLDGYSDIDPDAETEPEDNVDINEESYSAYPFTKPTMYSDLAMDIMKTSIQSSKCLEKTVKGQKKPAMPNSSPEESSVLSHDLSEKSTSKSQYSAKKTKCTYCNEHVTNSTWHLKIHMKRKCLSQFIENWRKSD